MCIYTHIYAYLLTSHVERIPMCHNKVRVTTRYVYAHAHATWATYVLPLAHWSTDMTQHVMSRWATCALFPAWQYARRQVRRGVSRFLTTYHHMSYACASSRIHSSYELRVCVRAPSDMTWHDVSQWATCALLLARQYARRRARRGVSRRVIWATGWRRLIGSPKLQIIFHNRATRHRSLLRKMTYEDKGSYESSPPCTCVRLTKDS